MSGEVSDFIASLQNPPNRQGVFNPWWEVDPEHDICEEASQMRRENLQQYLSERMGRLTYLLIGEAIGYQGGKFTGIPMTSERILLGCQKKRGILPEHVFSAEGAKRTSKVDLKTKGFSEPTGTIVWEQIIKSGRDPREFILWNAFPWHSYNPEMGRLSNRTPTQDELDEGRRILSSLIQMSRVKNIIAVGEKAYGLLHDLGFKPKKVRHPANGGSKQFREQFVGSLRSFGSD